MEEMIFLSMLTLMITVFLMRLATTTKPPTKIATTSILVELALLLVNATQLLTLLTPCTRLETMVLFLEPVT